MTKAAAWRDHLPKRTHRGELARGGIVVVPHPRARKVSILYQGRTVLILDALLALHLGGELPKVAIESGCASIAAERDAREEAAAKALARNGARRPTIVVHEAH